MTAADKIEDARALIKPLPVVKDGPWAVRAHWSHEEKREVYPTYSGKEPFAGEWTAIAEVEAHADDDGAASEEIARLIAAAPALRDTVAALADLADALTQRIEALEAALAACADDLEGWIHDGYDGVWSEADIQSKVAPYRTVLKADEDAE